MLTLGWQVTPTLAPQYWLDSKAKPGMQNESDLVQVLPGSLACHTAIVAQSGSGKSFFLGRLIEELTLKTKARCVILDPNADFRRISEVVDGARWKGVKFDFQNSRGFLPHEISKSIFKTAWDKIPKQIFAGPQLTSKNYKQLRLSLQSLSIEFLSEEITPMLRSDLYHCHEFVKAVSNLIVFKIIREDNHKEDKSNKATKDSGEIDLIDEVRKILQKARVGDTQSAKYFFENEFRPLMPSDRALGFRFFFQHCSRAPHVIKPNNKLIGQLQPWSIFLMKLKDITLVKLRNMQLKIF